MKIACSWTFDELHGTEISSTVIALFSASFVTRVITSAAIMSCCHGSSHGMTFDRSSNLEIVMNVGDNFKQTSIFDISMESV